jgi:serine O-acetyltransferase
VSNSTLIGLLQMDLVRLERSGRHLARQGAGWPAVIRKGGDNWPFRTVLLYRLAHASYMHGHWVVARFLSRLQRRSSGSLISFKARIGGGLFLPHPVGVVIGRDTEIGEYACINQSVTIGGNCGRRDPTGRRQPKLGNHCLICAGAVIAGPVEVGDFAVVGANAVVTRSVPAYAIVGGVPAKVLHMQSPESNWTTGSLRGEPRSPAVMAGQAEDTATVCSSA